MTKHDAKVIVEDAFRDAVRTKGATTLLVPVRQPTIDALRECRGESWFEQYSGMLYRDGKLIRFVLSSEGNTAA